MKSLRTLPRALTFALQNAGRNVWLSLATVIIFTLTLLTINLLVMLHVLTGVAVHEIESKIDVSIHFSKGTSEAVIFGARDYLESLSQVAGVEYVSAEDALERFSKRRRGDEEILQALDTVETNPFGGSLIVTATSADQFDFILEALNNPTFADTIQKKNFADHARIIDRINRFTGGLRIGALVLAGLFALIAVLIVLNAIRISIYTHRDEIGIMRLVGAHNSFIRLPFLLESLFFSVLATCLAAGIVLPVARLLEPVLSTFFGTSDVGLFAYYVEHIWFVFGLQLLGLGVLSVLASAFAIRRYLKV